jgi:hypothetical protein
MQPARQLARKVLAGTGLEEKQQLLPLECTVKCPLQQDQQAMTELVQASAEDMAPSPFHFTFLDVGQSSGSEQDSRPHVHWEGGRSGVRDNALHGANINLNGVAHKCVYIRQ